MDNNALFIMLLLLAHIVYIHAYLVAVIEGFIELSD